MREQDPTGAIVVHAVRRSAYVHERLHSLSGPQKLPDELYDAAEKFGTVFTRKTRLDAYVCTYRHYWPSPAQRRATASNATKDPLLLQFLDGYDDSFFDWGDDPSFFSALHRLKDVDRASWGVCRRDVRSTLMAGDLVVFFCGRQDKAAQCWNYYFVGYGTVGEVVDRRRLWIDPAYKPYRDFYNVLARFTDGKLTQHEYFHPYHDDWEDRRAVAPYIIFDPTLSKFNVTSPHQVATWSSGEKAPEIWRSDPRSRKLEKLLFEDRGVSRRLRTSTTGYAHAKLNLTNRGITVRAGLNVDGLRGALKPLVDG